MTCLHKTMEGLCLPVSGRRRRGLKATLDADADKLPAPAPPSASHACATPVSWHRQCKFTVFQPRGETRPG